MRDPAVEAAFERALTNFNGQNFDRLTHADKVLVTVYGLEAEVNNGGFNQYYFNGAGDQAFFAPEALHAIGAHKMASIVQRANAVFGPDGPSGTSSVRQSQYDLVASANAPDPWDDLDRQFYDYPDDIYALLGVFVRQGAAG